VKHQARMDVVAGLRELRRHTGLLHSDPMQEGQTLLSFPPTKMVYIESSCAMLVSSLENFWSGESISSQTKRVANAIDQNANRMQRTLSHAC
jgi:hypothetical protein